MNDDLYNESNVPPGTPSELVGQLNQELTSLRTMWDVFVDWSTNSPEGSTIPPIALLGFAFSMVHRSLHEVAGGQHVTCDGDDMMIINGYASFGSAMFRFGQFCQSQGVLASNMTELLTMSTDDEIRKFLGDV